jgi:hypothetical protein
MDTLVVVLREGGSRWCRGRGGGSIGCSGDNTTEGVRVRRSLWSPACSSTPMISAVQHTCTEDIRAGSAGTHVCRAAQNPAAHAKPHPLCVVGLRGFDWLCDNERFCVQAAMDQDTAKDMLRTGAVLVCLDVPEGTHVGVDSHAWVTASRARSSAA